MAIAVLAQAKREESRRVGPIVVEYILAVDKVRAEAFENARLCFEVEKVTAKYVWGVFAMLWKAAMKGSSGDRNTYRSVDMLPHTFTSCSASFC